MLVDEDRARARGQSLDRNFGTFFAGFMVSLFSVFVVVLSVWPPQSSNDTSRDFSAGSVRLASHDSLVENFERIVFAGGAQYYSAAWRISPTVVVTGRSANYLEPFVGALLKTVNLATGMTMTLRQTSAGTEDMYIRLVPRAEFHMRNALCYNSVSVRGPNQRNRKEYLVIPNDHSPARIRICVAHEMMHALGFKNHPSASFYSALNIHEDLDAFTNNDLILMRTLYDPAINPAMNRDKSWPLRRT